MRVIRLFWLSLSLLAVHPLSYAETNVSVFAGYRSGGEFEETDTGQKLRIDDEQSLGISISAPYTKNTKLEFVYSHQESRLSSDTAPEDVLIDLDIDYFHIGGLYTWPSERVEPYIVGTLGATYYNPSGGYDDEFRPSIGFGLGSFVYLTKNLGLKFEARGYTTMLDSGGAAFCGDSGCRIIAASSTLWQSELQAGLSLRF